MIVISTSVIGMSVGAMSRTDIALHELDIAVDVPNSEEIKFEQRLYIVPGLDLCCK